MDLKFFTINFIISSLIKIVFCGSTIKIYQDLAPDLSTNSLNLTMRFVFDKPELEEMHCLVYCERDPKCDLIIIETLLCEMYTMLKNYSLIHSPGTQVYIKTEETLIFMTNKVIGKFLKFLTIIKRFFNTKLKE